MEIHIKKNAKAHTHSEGQGSAAPAAIVRGMFSLNSSCSDAEANSARLSDALPTTGTLPFGPWFKPWIYQDAILSLFEIYLCY